MIRQRRALLVWLIGLLVVGGAARAIALPEVCGVTAQSDRDVAISEAVTWLSTNQNPDGTFMYRYDAELDEVLGGYNWIRHAGTVLALEQARAQGFEASVTPSELAIQAALDQSVSVSINGKPVMGLSDGPVVSTGGTALFALALLERRDTTGLTNHDDDIRAMLRFLVASLKDRADGSSIVRASANSKARFTSDEVALFATSQVLFVLARAERIFPHEQWGSHSHQILLYLTTYKANEEGFVPDMADHWAAYAMSEMMTWADVPTFSDTEIAWAKKQMGLSSVMIRYESQITDDGFNVLLRGHSAIGAAMGTHGEAVAGWVNFALGQSALTGQVRGLFDRLQCNSSLLVDRQITGVAARDFKSPSRVEGAWLSSGITQVDDQQHAMSALLMANNVNEKILVAGGELPRRDSVPSTLLVVLLTISLVSPPRFVRTLRHLHALRSAHGLVRRGSQPHLGYMYRFAFLFSIVILNGSRILHWLDTNVPTALIAAGVVGVLASFSAMMQRSTPPSLFYVVARPELVVFGLAVSADGRWWSVIIGLVLSSLWSRYLLKRTSDASLLWAARVCAAFSLALCIVLIVNGVFAV